MPRLRKLRRKQKYQYHINRRRLNEKRRKLPKINCDAVREAWDEKRSLSQNLTAMGLVADANKEFGLASDMKKVQEDDGNERAVSTNEEETPAKAHVVKTLEKDVKEQFQKKKEVAHLLPPDMCKKLCKFIDKYGEDYEAMSKDHSNYYQETPTQIRKQIERLKKIPQQWIPYLKSRGLISE